MHILSKENSQKTFCSNIIAQYNAQDIFKIVETFIGTLIYYPVLFCTQIFSIERSCFPLRFSEV